MTKVIAARLVKVGDAIDRLPGAALDYEYPVVVTGVKRGNGRTVVKGIDGNGSVVWIHLGADRNHIEVLA